MITELWVSRTRYALIDISDGQDRPIALKAPAKGPTKWFMLRAALQTAVAELGKGDTLHIYTYDERQAEVIEYPGFVFAWEAPSEAPFIRDINQLELQLVDAGVATITVSVVNLQTLNSTLDGFQTLAQRRVVQVPPPFSDEDLVGTTVMLTDGESENPTPPKAALVIDGEEAEVVPLNYQKPESTDPKLQAVRQQLTHLLHRMGGQGVVEEILKDLRGSADHKI